MNFTSIICQKFFFVCIWQIKCMQVDMHKIFFDCHRYLYINNIFLQTFFWLESLALEENPREQLLINLSKISIFKIFKIAVFHFQVVPFFKITSQLIFPRLSHLVAFAELHEYDRYGNDGVSDTLVVQKRNDFLCDMIENVHTLQAAI